jgi:hypothetical protein
LDPQASVGKNFLVVLDLSSRSSFSDFSFMLTVNSGRSDEFAALDTLRLIQLNFRKSILWAICFFPWDFNFSANRFPITPSPKASFGVRRKQSSDNQMNESNRWISV